jgi:peptidoglycan-associated lipoprotein
MFKVIKPLALAALITLLCSCGSDTVKGPNPEDTILVNTSEVRPDWIEELDLSGQASVINELEQEGLEIRESVLVDPNIWGDPNSPKVTIRFDLDKWVVRPVDQTLIEKASETLLENADLRVLLTGYCDWRGTTDYNLALGEKRANSVKDYLVSLGVSPERVEILSRGDLDAIIEATPAQMAEERRVEIIIVR